MDCDTELPLAVTGAPTALLALIGVVLLGAGLLARRAGCRTGVVLPLLLAVVAAVQLGVGVEPAAAEDGCAGTAPARVAPLEADGPAPTAAPTAVPPTSATPASTALPPTTSTSTSSTSSTTTTTSSSSTTSSTTTTVFAPVH